MNISNWVNGLFADERLIANLVAIHLILAVLLVTAVVLRRILTHGGDQFARWTGLHWLDGFSKEATRKLRGLLFWLVLAMMAGSVIGGIAYHVSGRDMRGEVVDWYSHVTGAQMLRLGLALGQLVLLGLVLNFSLRLVRRALVTFEIKVLAWLPQPAHEAMDPRPGEDAPPPIRQERQEDTVKRWFSLLERFALVSVVLCGAWVAGHIVRLHETVDVVVGFTLRLMSILVVARLLTLACRTVSHALSHRAPCSVLVVR